MVPAPSPPRRALRATLSLAFACALVATPREASADPTKAECIDANTRGQDLRRDGKLSAAREQLRRCAVPACPAMVRDDCAKRLDEVDRLQPTVIFAVKDAAGHDVTAVKIAVDGKPLAESIDGSELPIDPGPHVFTFTAEGQPPVTTKLVLAAGEKDRRERITLGGVAGAGTAAGATGAAGAQGHAGHLVVAADPDASIAVDGQTVGKGRFDASESSGPHTVLVTASGKRAYKADVDLRDGETRTLEVSLEAEHGSSAWPWIVGGVVVAAGASVGGYFLFRSSPAAPANPPAQLGSLQLNAWGTR